MKSETWEFIKFHVLLGIKFALRLTIAPYVGAVRGVWVMLDKFHAEITAYCDAERKAQQDPGSSEKAIG